MSEFDSERVSVGGAYDGQRFLLRKGQAGWPLMNEDGKAIWYRGDPDDPTRALYSGPEPDGMNDRQFEASNDLESGAKQAGTKALVSGSI